MLGQKNTGRDYVVDLHAIVLQGDHFFRVIGDHAAVLYAQGFQHVGGFGEVRSSSPKFKC